MSQSTQLTHINDIEIGDQILMYQALVATVTGYQITGKGYQRIYGYYEGEESDPHLLESCNCYLHKIVATN